MTVYGPNEKTGDSVVSRIKEEISNLNSKYSYKNMIKLPSKIGNNSVTYSEPKNNSKINNWIMVMIIGLVVILAISIGIRKDLDKEIEEKNRVLLMNYSELICKFRLLLCAGLNITAVWEKICEEYLHNKEMTGEINYTYSVTSCIICQLSNCTISYICCSTISINTISIISTILIICFNVYNRIIYTNSTIIVINSICIIIIIIRNICTY